VGLNNLHDILEAASYETSACITVLDLSGNSIVTMEGLKDMKLLTWLRNTLILLL
jgi:hypothetical protein